MSDIQSIITEAFERGAKSVVDTTLLAAGARVKRQGRSFELHDERLAAAAWLILERNPNYWKSGRPYLDRIVLRVIPDGAARAIALSSEKRPLSVSLSANVLRSQLRS